MPSFDVVSELSMHEVDNAVQQASKEVGQRYDFKGSDTSVERKDEGIVLKSDSEVRVNACLQVLNAKLVKRSVSLKSFDAGAVEAGGGGTYKQVLALKEGISKELAKKIVKELKDSKLKIQASIQGDTVRVTGKKRDDLQEAIAFLKQQDLDAPLSYTNFRD